MEQAERYHVPSGQATVLVVPLKTGPARLDALYTLNETAGFIWRQIDRGMAEDEIVARVIAAYEVDEVTAQNDVRRALDGLAAIVSCAIPAQSPRR